MSGADRPILVHRLAAELRSDDARAARDALRMAMDRLAVPPEAELALVLSDDPHLQDLNRSFRGQDKPTDVLSFPADPADPATQTAGEPPYLGDIIISVPRAAAQAQAAGQPLADELRLLAVHGLLHLLGYEDETEAGAEAMRRMELALGVRRG